MVRGCLWLATTQRCFGFLVVRRKQTCRGVRVRLRPPWPVARRRHPTSATSKRRLGQRGIIIPPTPLCQLPRSPSSSSLHFTSLTHSNTYPSTSQNGQGGCSGLWPIRVVVSMLTFVSLLRSTIRRISCRCPSHLTVTPFSFPPRPRPLPPTRDHPRTRTRSSQPAPLAPLSARRPSLSSRVTRPSPVLSPSPRRRRVRPSPSLAT